MGRSARIGVSLGYDEVRMGRALKGRELIAHCRESDATLKTRVNSRYDDSPTQFRSFTRLPAAEHNKEVL
jgi:hypothetical protein